MLVLMSSDNYNGPYTHAISEYKDNLLKEIPEDFVFYDDSWVHPSDLKWFKGEEGDGDDDRQAHYYWISKTNIKIV